MKRILFLGLILVNIGVWGAECDTAPATIVAAAQSQQQAETGESILTLGVPVQGPTTVFDFSTGVVSQK